MFPMYEELKCEKCEEVSEQETSCGQTFEDEKGLFHMYFGAKCPKCGNLFNSDRAKNARKTGAFM